jgi:hypothetical protein
MKWNWFDLEKGDRVKFTEKYLRTLNLYYHSNREFVKRNKDKIFIVKYVLIDENENYVFISINDGAWGPKDYMLKSNGSLKLYDDLSNSNNFPVFELISLRKENANKVNRTKKKTIQRNLAKNNKKR